MVFLFVVHFSAYGAMISSNGMAANRFIISFSSKIIKLSLQMSVKSKIIPLQISFVPLQSKIVPLQFSFVPLQSKIIPLQFSFVPLQSKIIRLKKGVDCSNTKHSL